MKKHHFKINTCIAESQIMITLLLLLLCSQNTNYLFIVKSSWMKIRFYISVRDRLEF